MPILQIDAEHHRLCRIPMALEEHTEAVPVQPAENTGSLTGPAGEPEKLGAALAADLIDQGARAILELARAGVAVS